MQASPTAQDPTAQDPTAQDPTAQDPTAQDPTAQDPTAQDPTAQDPTAQDPTAQDPTAQGVVPTAQDPTAQDSTAQGVVPTAQDATAGVVAQDVQGPLSFSARFGQDFAANFSITVFAALFLCYTVQAALAAIRAATKESVRGSDGEQRQVTLWQVVRIYDGGMANVWTFFILAIFSPVLLTGLGNILPFVQISTHPDRLSAALYSLCLAAIGVIITLELSYVHNLRTSAKDWIPMLVVAIALDIITLVVFFSFVINPHQWGVPLAPGTRTTMLSATVAAVMSSFMILIFARCAGALTDGQVSLPAADAPAADLPASAARAEEKGPPV